MPQFFTVKFSLWVIGGMLLALLATVVTEEIRLHDIRAQLKTAQDDLGVCQGDLRVSQGNEAVLSETLKTQNTKIKAMQAESARRAAEAAAAAKEALQRAEKLKADDSNLGNGPDVMNEWQKRIFQ